jgi:hypothetical protein
MVLKYNTLFPICQVEKLSAALKCQVIFIIVILRYNYWYLNFGRFIDELVLNGMKLVK